MPPRPRGDNLLQEAAGSGEQPQGQEHHPITGDDLPQPPVKLVAPSVPVFGEGVTATKLRSKLRQLEIERAPRVARRKYANLQVNTWNLCEAKKRKCEAHGGIDAPVKGIIMQFIGDAPADSEPSDPKFSAEYMQQVAAASKRKQAKAVMDSMVGKMKECASNGNRACTLRYGDVPAIKTQVLTPQKPEQAVDNWWEWLFQFLPTLREQITAAGFEVEVVPVVPQPPLDEGRQNLAGAAQRLRNARSKSQEDSELVLAW